MTMSNYRTIELRRNKTGIFIMRITIYPGDQFSGVRKFLGLKTGSERTALRRARMVWHALLALGHYTQGVVRVTHLSGEPGYVEWDSADCLYCANGVSICIRTDEAREDSCLIVRVPGCGKKNGLTLLLYGWRDDAVAQEDARTLAHCLRNCAKEWQSPATRGERVKGKRAGKKRAVFDT